jgi:hypothetical protein
MNKITSIILFFIFLFFISCDGGLKPPERSFIKGKIIYLGGKENWPPQDSVFGVRVFAFKKLPKDTSDILQEILGGNAVFDYQSLPLFVDSTDFYLEMPETPIDLEYIAVALQYASAPTSQKVISVYSESGNPAAYSGISLKSGESRENIRFLVDFNNLPPQPF